MAVTILIHCAAVIGRHNYHSSLLINRLTSSSTRLSHLVFRQVCTWATSGTTNTFFFLFQFIIKTHVET